MPSGLETADELLALWADLLRERSGIVRAPALQVSVLYASEQGAGLERTYSSTMGNSNVAAGLREIILQDINDRIASVENALSEFGVKVFRPASTSDGWPGFAEAQEQ